MKRILQSKLYQSLAAGRNDIELWEDNHLVDGWTRFSIVSRRQGDATILAELRANDDQVQRRVVDDHGLEQWLAAE